MSRSFDTTSPKAPDLALFPLPFSCMLRSSFMCLSNPDPNRTQQTPGTTSSCVVCNRQIHFIPSRQRSPVPLHSLLASQTRQYKT
uniref:Uncharacterized protein n=1 Tax=Zea mays TaxID=4577 RepID=B6SJ82_MAIZE|nr:hypothetical protein [Zea mays]